MESLLDLGMCLPSTVRNNDHEMPLKHRQICGYEGSLLTGSWPLPAASTKIKSWLLQDADLQHPLERSSGWRQKIKSSFFHALGALGKPQKNRPSDSQMFLGKDFYESKFLYLLMPRKTNVMNQCLDQVLLASPSAVFLYLLIFGTYIFNFLVKFVSPSSSTTRISIHPANTQTMLEQAALSFYGPSSPSINAPQGPQAILPLRSYMGDHPQW